MNCDVLGSYGTVTVNGSASLKANEIEVLQGTFAVENSATLIATSVGVYGTGNLVAETGGVIDANQFAVSSGTAVIQPGSALTMTNPPPADGQVIVQGNGSAHPGVLTIDGQLNNAGYVGVFSDGTLTIGNGQTVTFSAALYGRADLRLNGGTVDVSKGQLIIGTPLQPAGLGWVTVGTGGTLDGGWICPADSTATDCPPFSLYSPIGSKVIGSVLNSDGTVSVGDPTTINISQDFQQTSGTLDLQIYGTQPGQYDQLIAGGSIQITGGTVQFDFGNGFAPAAGNVFNLLTASGAVSISGATFTYQGLASGFNYTTGMSGGQFNLTAQNSVASTTSPPAPFVSTGISQLSSAAGGVPALAPGSLASVFAASGTSYSSGQPSAPGLPWPASINGTSVTIVDFTDASTTAPLTYVSSSQVNFQIPDTVALGPAIVTVTSGTETVATGLVILTTLAPSLFTLNSSNLAAAYAACVSSSGAITTETPFQAVNGAIEAQALNLGACSQTILELYGTGLDYATASGTQVMFGEVAGMVQYAGPGGGFPGLDQINVVIPQSLAGKGSVPIMVSTGGMTSNTVNVTIQ